MERPRKHFNRSLWVGFLYPSTLVPDAKNLLDQQLVFVIFFFLLASLFKEPKTKETKIFFSRRFCPKKHQHFKSNKNCFFESRTRRDQTKKLGLLPKKKFFPASSKLTQFIESRKSIILTGHFELNEKQNPKNHFPSPPKVPANSEREG